MAKEGQDLIGNLLDSFRCFYEDKEFMAFRKLSEWPFIKS